MSVAGDARKMLLVLRERGWFQALRSGGGGFELRRRNGGVHCILTSSYDLESVRGVFTTTLTFGGVPIYAAIAGVIRAEFPDRGDACEDCFNLIVQFNDHPDTVFADVELVLEKVGAGSDV